MREEITQKIDASSNNQVDLGKMAVKDFELEEIIDLVFLTKPHITMLFLNHNEISDVGCIILQKSLDKLTHLTFLDLQFNDIDKEGAFALMTLKANTPNLQIALHGNRIIDAGEMQEIEKAAEQTGKNG